MRKSVVSVVAVLALVAIGLVGVALASAYPGDEVSRAFNVDASSPIQVAAAEGSYALVIRGMSVSSDTAGVVTLRDGAADGDVIAQLYLEANKPTALGWTVLGEGAAISKRDARPPRRWTPGQGGIRASSGSAIYAEHSAAGTFTGLFLCSVE